MNICQCGTQAGYPHPSACPYPYYGNAGHLITGWQSAAADLAQATEDAASDTRGTYLVRQSISVEAVFLVKALGLPDPDTCQELLTRVTLDEFDRPEGVEVLSILVESAEIRDTEAEPAECAGCAASPMTAWACEVCGGNA